MKRSGTCRPNNRRRDITTFQNCALVAVAIFALIIFAIASSTRQAAAEAVRVMVGANSFGAGWIFLDASGCFVITAAHVVRSGDGVVRPALIRDAGGREWTTGAALVMSSDPDIAVLPVSGANDVKACGTPGRSRLQIAGIAERARVLRDGLIETTGRTETLRVAVDPFAARADAGRGEIFAVRPRNPGDRVVEGWSGSPVTDRDGLVGIVIEAETGSDAVLAVRADAVARLITQARNLTPPPAAVNLAQPNSFAISVLRGATLDPAHGPQQVLGSSGNTSWIVQPDRGAVELALRAAREQSFSSVEFAVDAASAARLDGVEISVALPGREGEEFLPVNFCRPRAEQTLVCRFLPQLRRSLRLSASFRGAEPVTILSLSVR